MKKRYIINDLVFEKFTSSHLLRLNGSIIDSREFFNNLLGFKRDYISRNKYIYSELGLYCNGFSPHFQTIEDLEKFIDYCKNLTDKRMVLKSSIFKL